MQRVPNLKYLCPRVQEISRGPKFTKWVMSLTRSCPRPLKGYLSFVGPVHRLTYLEVSSVKYIARTCGQNRVRSTNHGTTEPAKDTLTHMSRTPASCHRGHFCCNFRAHHADLNCGCEFTLVSDVTRCITCHAGALYYKSIDNPDWLQIDSDVTATRHWSSSMQLALK